MIGHAILLTVNVSQPGVSIASAKIVSKSGVELSSAIFHLI